jgi:uncharacterized protein YcfJ
MKNIIAASLIALAVAGCTQTEESTVIGAAAGGLIGAAVGDTEGAIIGAGAGAVAGALIGRANEPGRCYYRDGYGRRYIAAC